MIQRYTRNTSERYKELRKTEKRLHKNEKKWFYESQLKMIELNKLTSNTPRFKRPISVTVLI
jgi:hypothetical protein